MPSTGGVRKSWKRYLKQNMEERRRLCALRKRIYDSNERHHSFTLFKLNGFTYQS